MQQIIAPVWQNFKKQELLSLLFVGGVKAGDRFAKTKQDYRQHKGPYQHFATPEQFKVCYPKWKAVIEHKNAVDPTGLIENGFYADYFF